MFKKFILIMLLLVSGFIYSQSTLTGTVKDAQGNPIPGVNIIITGGTSGAVTDFDGNFSISVVPEDVLEFSSIGFQTRNILVGDQTAIQVILQENISALDEIIVTGYTSQARKSITGAIAIVDVEELANLPDQSVLGQIQGRVTGVQIGKNSGPGGIPIVRIRGYGNVSTGNEPLYIIDGVQSQSGRIFNLINPADIESIQVLKDASATAIYGSRANNGVIIVSTKKGVGAELGGGTEFGFNFSYSHQTPRTEAFPEFLTPQQYAEYLWTKDLNGGTSPNSVQYGSGATPVLPVYLTPAGVSAVDESTYALIPGGDNNPIKKANHEGTDWLNEIFTPAPLINFNLSSSKNTENSNSYISAGYSSNQGILTHTSFERYSVRANTEFRVNDFLTFGESITLAYTEQKGAGGSQNEGGPIMMAHRIQNIIPVYDIRGNFAGTAGGALGNASNPLASLTRGMNNVGRDLRGIGSVFANIHFLEYLDFKSTIAADYSNANSSSLTPLRLEDQEQQTTNRFSEANFLNREFTFTNTLVFNKDIDVHTLNILGGVEYNSRRFRTFGAFRNNFASEDIDFLYLDAGDAGNQFNNGSGNEVNLFSYFARGAYDFSDKFYFTASVRVDESSRYIEANRRGIFPAVGVAYRLSEESFIQDLGIFDNLKVRAAWGQTGNSETPNAYPTFSTFGLNATTNNYDVTGSSSSALLGYAAIVDGNSTLVWETAETIDAAIELGLLNNNLVFEFGYYNRETKDMLVQVPRPGTSGLAADPYVNIGDMLNTGFETLISYQGKITEDIGFQIGANASFNKNEVVRLSDNDESFVSGRIFRQNRLTRTQKGQPISSFYGFEIDKDDKFYTTQAEVTALGQSNGAVGSFKYKDTNGDGKITDADRTFIGSPHPDAIFGINFGISYQNMLSLTAFLDGTYGNDIYNFKKYFTDFHFFPGAVTTNVLDSWTPNNPNAILPLNSSTITNQEIPNSYYIEDGSYLRVRNIKLSYNLPANILKSLKMRNADVFVQVDNAFVFTQYSGLDPEINIITGYEDSDVNLNLGIDRGAYPNPRSL